jgi:23S rRNA pseudouridine1911/1915/1917 synthase
MNFTELEVLYEDNHIIAVNKPSGMLVQGDDTGDLPLVDVVKEYIKFRYKKPGDVFLGVVHRIDRPVSGVVIYARTSKALERLNAMFAGREMEKVYWAVCTARPDPLEATLVHYLVKDTTKNITHAYDRERKGTKRCELSYALIAELGSHYMVRVEPLTGRSHQIRSQLGKIGSPIRGDLKYGASAPMDDASIMLHARELRFVHPVKKEDILIVAPVPKFTLWRQFELSQEA